MRKFFTFAGVGGLGTVTNLVLFALLVDFLHGPAVPAAILCNLVAATQNYFLNHFWTFRDANSGRASRLLHGWGKFLVGSLVGLAINLLVLRVFLGFFPFATVAQFLGIVAALGVNFYIAKRFVFGSK
ncbi:GtrA family protein [Dyella sp. 20L07]|uniref:GtrA family protein n=1 Tax=Dyella sp. 20L07 TaxID=3384240 RepID=UPI003D2CCAC1